jgi:hypothetical protein
MAGYEVGDHVRWDSVARAVSGRIIRTHTRDFDYKGHTHCAREEDPQCEIKRGKTDHIAAHRGAVLRRIA